VSTPARQLPESDRDDATGKDASHGDDGNGLGEPAIGARAAEFTCRSFSRFQAERVTQSGDSTTHRSLGEVTPRVRMDDRRTLECWTRPGRLMPRATAMTTRPTALGKCRDELAETRQRAVAEAGTQRCAVSTGIIICERASSAQRIGDPDAAQRIEYHFSARAGSENAENLLFEKPSMRSSPAAPRRGNSTPRHRRRKNRRRRFAQVSAPAQWEVFLRLSIARTWEWSRWRPTATGLSHEGPEPHVRIAQQRRAGRPPHHEGSQ